MEEQIILLFDNWFVLGEWMGVPKKTSAFFAQLGYTEVHRKLSKCPFSFLLVLAFSS